MPSIRRTCHCRGHYPPPYAPTCPDVLMLGSSLPLVSLATRFATTSRTRTKFSSFAIPACPSTSAYTRIKPVCLLVTRHARRSLRARLARAVEYMLVDALTLAEPAMNIARRLEDPKKYLYLTDEIKREIQASEDPVLPLFVLLVASLLTASQRRNSPKPKPFCTASTCAIYTSPSISRCSRGT